MNVLLIRNGVVENCIAADSLERAQQFYPDYSCVERKPGMAVGPGDLWNGKKFTAAPPPPPPPTLPITKLEFLRRLGAENRMRMRAAVATDPVMADAMGMLELADMVYTEHPDTQMFVGYCVQQGFLTPAQAAVVLE